MSKKKSEVKKEPAKKIEDLKVEAKGSDLDIDKIDDQITEDEEILEEIEKAKEDLHEAKEPKGCGCKVVFSKTFPKGKFPGDTKANHLELVKEWAMTAFAEGKLVIRTFEQKGGEIVSEVGQKPE